ncbi:hypothetical protein C1645_816783 [Glomus cerebriforme]|uniref:F-box domain-containing protein n=1 Tax=Glomus cerebriforme TaxID=658196 RepID=A0A397TG85_9GLOM|nr:hypothetical protein C1645_816783 [Glomus cerebriforme]
MNNFKVINTLLSYLNEEEISLLIPCAINLPNNKSPLFEYGKFIREINHYKIRNHVKTWLDAHYNFCDCRVPKLIDVIYHVIMRQGCKLESINIYYELPKPSIFANYELGIKNLYSLKMECIDFKVDTIEFLSMLSIKCNKIVECNLKISYNRNLEINPLIDIIKSQPLKKVLIETYSIDEITQRILNALEFRSKTLKMLKIKTYNFQRIDLLFIANLECLEHLELFLHYSGGSEIHNYETLTKKKFQFKVVRLWYKHDFETNLLNVGIITSWFVGESLRKLYLNFVTLETIKAVLGGYKRSFGMSKEELKIINYLVRKGVDIVQSNLLIDIFI